MHIAQAENELRDLPHIRTGRRLFDHPRRTKDRVVGNYKLGKVIGKGSYGQVLKATNLKTQQVVIVKILQANRESSQSGISETAQDTPSVDPRIKNQIQIQRSLDHPNIAKIYEVIETDDQVYIFMEYCPKGQLFDYLRAEGPLSLERASQVFQQIFSAVKYLHEHGIAHRDIKAENIVFDQNMDVKLIDFGLAKNYNIQNEKERLKTFCGSPSYTPPQILLKKKYNGELADVWSLGVTLYAMLEASLPFDEKISLNTAHNIKKMMWHPSQSSPDEAIELYKSIFLPMTNRFSLQQIQESAFYKKYCLPKNNKRSPLSMQTQSVEYQRVQKTLEIKRKTPFAEAGKSMKKFSRDNSKVSRNQIVSVDSLMRRIDDQNFRIRLTPKKIHNKASDYGVKNFFLQPHLIQP